MQTIKYSNLFGNLNVCTQVINLPSWGDCSVVKQNNSLIISSNRSTSKLVLGSVSATVLPTSILFKSGVISQFKTVVSRFKQCLINHYKPFFIILRLRGTNFRFNTDNPFTLEVGKSHKISFAIPFGVKVNRYTESKDSFIVSGSDSVLVRNFVDQLRRCKPINPYTGTGLLFNGQKIKLKQGKKK
jgi:hypothetical protein